MRVGSWLAAAVLVGVGCGSSSGQNSQTGGPDANDVITCQNDPRVATYASGLTVSSTSGSHKYVLLSSDPAPPARGTDTWKIHITDAQGTALSGLAASVVPFMPDHGHGSSVNASVTANSDGTYTVAPLYFFMPGVWRVEFAVPPNQLSDVGDFFFCVPG
jgi:YtkA-like